MESAPRVPSIGRLETTVTVFSPNPDDGIVLIYSPTRSGRSPRQSCGRVPL